MVNISVDDQTGPSETLTRSYKLSVTAATETAPAGIQNDGYWGIAVHPNTTYTGSVVPGGSAFFDFTVPANGTATLTLDGQIGAGANLQLVIVRTQ